MDPAEKPLYQRLKPWLASTFGRDVYRVALDAGSTCPNRDGTKAFGGCTYCDVEGSGTGALRTGQELAAQLEAGIRRVQRRGERVGVIAYLQSYSNTYVELDRLREVLAVVEPWISKNSSGANSSGAKSLGAPVVALSIATRPDTFSPEAAAVLAELNTRLPVWVEFGLEAADDRVLEEVRRFHTVAEFEDAVARAHAHGLLTVGHAILGLPGDGRAGAARTGRALAAAQTRGVKVHNLMILRRTQLEKAWKRGEIDVLDAPTYVEWLADFVEELAPDQVLHRITGDAPIAERLAPQWSAAKNAIHELLAEELTRRGTRQGSRYAPRDVITRA